MAGPAAPPAVGTNSITRKACRWLRSVAGPGRNDEELKTRAHKSPSHCRQLFADYRNCRRVSLLRSATSLRHVCTDDDRC